jgi:hypothetical protein
MLFPTEGEPNVIDALAAAHDLLNDAATKLEEMLPVNRSREQESA